MLMMVSWQPVDRSLVFQKGPFVLQSPPVSAYHQQLWLIAQVNTDYNGGTQALSLSPGGVLIAGTSVGIGWN